jgi:hypothetical protein
MRNAVPAVRICLRAVAGACNPAFRVDELEDYPVLVTTYELYRSSQGGSRCSQPKTTLSVAISRYAAISRIITGFALGVRIKAREGWELLQAQQ